MKEFITIHKKDSSSVEIPLESLLKTLGICAEDVQYVGLKVEDAQGASLEAYQCGDAEYPGITVDGHSGDALYYLATSELPNPDHDSIVTYVYAGNADTETDDWIARVCNTPREENDNSKKLIYIDYRLVETAPAHLLERLERDCSTANQVGR